MTSSCDEATTRSSASKLCPFCKELILEEAVKCKHCKSTLPPASYCQQETRDGNACGANTVEPACPPETHPAAGATPPAPGTLVVPRGTGKILGWFALANFAVLMSLVVISGGAAAGLAPYLLLVGATAPFIMLFMSKWLAKRAHDIRLIDPQNFQGQYEATLYGLVDTLRQRAGIEAPLEVGIYESEDMNAFATGATRKSSMVAFSTGLLNKMDEEAITAVAAHEIAHIANSDMLILTLVQSVVNAIVLLISLPFRALKIATFFSDKASWVDYLLVTIVHVLVTSVLVFLGNLVVKAFSRQREFRADKLAGALVGNPYMIHALKALQQDSAIAPASQVAYAAFKINSPPGWADIFSTHPSLARRIAALQETC